MTDIKLSPLAEELYSTLDSLQAFVSLSISQMAYESANDQEISATRRAAYWEIYHLENDQPIY